jgi:hypothetical protein
MHGIYNISKLLHVDIASVPPFFSNCFSQRIQIVAYKNEINKIITSCKIGKKRYVVFYNKKFHFVRFQYVVNTLRLKL